MASAYIFCARPRPSASPIALIALIALIGMWPADLLAASPRWSSSPRWGIQRERPRACPSGWKRRGLTRLKYAECADDPSAAPQPPPKAKASQPHDVRPAPRPGPEAPQAHAPQPQAQAPPPSASSGRWTRPPRLDGYPDANALMSMSSGRCRDYLREHEVAVIPVSPRQAPEVEQPVRLAGPIAGITYSIPWSKDPNTDPHTVWDCRLVAAMIPLSRWLAAYGVTEIQYFSALRQGAAARQRPRSQHNVGLAFDLLGLRRGDEPLAKVDPTYPSRRLRRCPAAAPGADASPADLYLALVCEAYQHRLVHTLLTPDHDRAHENHLHIDLKADQRPSLEPYVSFAP